MEINNLLDLAENVLAYQQVDMPTLWKNSRIEIGFSASELAAALGVTAAQISYIESGQRQPNSELIVKFSEIYKAKKAYISAIREAIKKYVDESGMGRIEIQEDQEGVVFLDENQFVPFWNLGYSTALGFYTLSMFPNTVNKIKLNIKE